jgi:DNA-binding transcriptional LysR family regulator
MLNLKSLESFRAIMQTGSATAAAKQMGLTQPGISRLLASLEQEIGYALFYREHSRLIPTDEASRLDAEIELLLSSTSRFLALARNMHRIDSGSLTIVAPASFSSGPLADALASFIRRYPAISVSLDSHSPQQARDLVAQRSIDCGFIQLPEQHPGLISYPILQSPMVCAVPAQHALAAQSSIALAQLASEPLIMLGKGRPSRQNLEQLFHRAGVALQVKLETHNVATACALVKRQLGIAIINQVLAEQFLDTNIKLVALTDTISHQYGFIHSAHVPMPRLVQAFYQHCVAFFATATPSVTD